MRQRDLIGYGGRPPSMVWPNGARVAVSLVVNFEEGAELAVGDGDDISERLGEVISVVEPGRRDLGQEEMFAYGMRVGLWRFLDAFDRHKRPATFYMCGRAVERLPQLAAEIVNRGHEPACHGWLWRPHRTSPIAPREGISHPLHRHHQKGDRRTAARLLLSRKPKHSHTRPAVRTRLSLRLQRLRRRPALYRACGARRNARRTLFV